MLSITDLLSLQGMLASERALVIFVARWSGPARGVLHALKNFEKQFSNNIGLAGLELTVWEFDVDSPAPLSEAMREWLDRFQIDSHLFLTSGAGSIVWCRQGEIVDSELCGAAVSSLLDRTQVAFS